MSDVEKECDQGTTVKANNVPFKASQNGNAVTNNKHNDSYSPSKTAESEESDETVQSNSCEDLDDSVPCHPTQEEATQEYDNPSFVMGEEESPQQTNDINKSLENSAYITQLNGSLLNETSITIPDDALLNHYSGRVRLKKKEDKLVLGDMKSESKVNHSENGHSTTEPLSNGVLHAANGKTCDSSASEKSALKETVPVTSPVTSEKFNSKKVFEEYFIPANTHKKFLRGEKLYLSNESELSSACSGCSWKRALISVLVLVLLAGATLIGALAATGFFTAHSYDVTSRDPSSLDTQSHHSSLPSPPVSQPRGGLPPPSSTTSPYHVSPSSTREVPRQVTVFETKEQPFSTEAPVTSATSFVVPKVYVSLLSGKIVILNKNFSDSLSDRRSNDFQTLASDIERQLEVVYRDLKSFAHAKVLSLQPTNSIVVKFILTWHSEEVSAVDAAHLLFSYLGRHGGFLGPYLLDPLAIKLKKESSLTSTEDSVGQSSLISSPAIEETTFSQHTEPVPVTTSILSETLMNTTNSFPVNNQSDLIEDLTTSTETNNGFSSSSVPVYSETSTFSINENNTSTARSTTSTESVIIEGRSSVDDENSITSTENGTTDGKNSGYEENSVTSTENVTFDGSSVSNGNSITSTANVTFDGRSSVNDENSITSTANVTIDERSSFPEENSESSTENMTIDEGNSANDGNSTTSASAANVTIEGRSSVNDEEEIPNIATQDTIETDYPALITTESTTAVFEQNLTTTESTTAVFEQNLTTTEEILNITSQDTNEPDLATLVTTAVPTTKAFDNNTPSPISLTTSPSTNFTDSDSTVSEENNILTTTISDGMPPVSTNMLIDIDETTIQTLENVTYPSTTATILSNSSDEVTASVSPVLTTTEALYEAPTTEVETEYSTVQDDSLLTLAPPTTTNRANRMESEDPYASITEPFFNTSEEETLTYAITTEEYHNYSSSTSELTTHGTTILFTEAAPTPESFALTIGNETEDGIENVPTEEFLVDENSTYPSSMTENTDLTSRPSPTTQLFTELVEPMINENESSITTSPTFNPLIIVLNNSSDTDLENDSNITRAYNDSSTTEVQQSEDEMNYSLYYNDTSTEPTYPSSNLTFTTSSNYNSSDSYDNSTFPTEPLDISSDYNDTVNYDFDHENSTRINDTVEYESAIDESLDAMLTDQLDNTTEGIEEMYENSTFPDLFNSTNMDLNISADPDSVFVTEDLVYGNGTEDSFFSQNGSMVPVENDSFVDGDVAGPFNESGEMFHHTPDADNITAPEGCNENEEFSCLQGAECLPKNKKCDGMHDCRDGSDEKECDSDCGLNFQCANQSRCIMMKLRCDGVEDCDDSSDEEGCAPNECEQHEVMCLDKSVCIKASEICDGHYNCHDKSDERDCVDRTTCMGEGKFYCSDGLCLPSGLQCDGAKDCKKGEDEENCTCIDNQFQCADGKCIDIAFRCDGNRNCSDGSDEMECMRVDTNGAVLVYSPFTDNWNLLCVTDEMPWEEEDGHKLCQEMSYSGAKSVGRMAVRLSSSMLDKENAGWTLKNMTVAINATYWTAGMTHTNTCDSGLVATLICKDYICGTLPNQTTPDGKPQPLEQWPFLATISANPETGDGNKNVASSIDDTKGQDNSFGQHLNSINSNRTCRAEILSPLWLITAAGCIQHLPKSNMTAWIDQVDLPTSKIIPSAHQWRQVSHVTMHPHLSRFRSHVLHDYDLALVKLTQPLDFTKMSAVCLPEAEVNPGITCFTGSAYSMQARQQRQQVQQSPQLTHQQQQDPAEAQLQPNQQSVNEENGQSNAPNSAVITSAPSSANFLASMVRDRTSCNEEQHYRGWVGSRMFCTDSEDKLCHDEAAPLMCYSIQRGWYLAGMLSYHRLCGIYKKHPSVFANVFPMRGYIEKVIGKRQYGVAYNEATYNLTPLETTLSPTTTLGPQLEYESAALNGSQLESFIQNNQSSDYGNMNDLGDIDTNITAEEGNFTGYGNESTGAPLLYAYSGNETITWNTTDYDVESDFNISSLNDTQMVENQTSYDEYPVTDLTTGWEIPDPDVIYEHSNDSSLQSSNTSSNVSDTETVTLTNDFNMDDEVNNTGTDGFQDYLEMTTSVSNSSLHSLDNSTEFWNIMDMDEEFRNVSEREDLCNQTDIESYQCLGGDQCVYLHSICDGVYDCPDQSDEWQCIRLDEKFGILEVRHVLHGSVDEWLPVCADSWQGFLSHRVCHQLGYKSSLVTTYLPVHEHKELESKFKRGSFAVQEPDARLAQGALSRQINSTCNSEQLLSIRCSEIQCSLWSAAGDSEELLEESRFSSPALERGRSLGGSQSTSGGSSLAQDGQWPSLILLRSKGENQQALCTANVLSQRWILTSWSCLLTDSRIPGKINSSHWEVISNSCASQSSDGSCQGAMGSNPPLSEVERIVVHPEARAGQCSYHNDLALIRLSAPLQFSRFTNAVCLPQQPLNPPREVCFLASYHDDPTVGPTRPTSEGTSDAYKDEVKPEIKSRMSVGSSLQYLPVTSMSMCPAHINDTRTDSLLCSQIRHSQGNDDPEQVGGGASLMCINENHQWELHGLATPSIEPANKKKTAECQAYPKGTYTNLFAYAQWVANTLRSH